MRALVLLLVVGCYSPAVTVGEPCSTQGHCPGGQVCVAGTCQRDAPPDATTDAPLVVVDGKLDGAVGDAPGDAQSGWAPPAPVPGLDMQPGGQTDPSFTADRLTLVYSDGADLFIGVRPATTSAFVVTTLTALNSTAAEVSPEISANGNTIYFTSERATPGLGDVYRSRLEVNGWSVPVPVTELNNAADDEGDVAVAPDGLTAIVARNNSLLRTTRATTTSTWGTLSPTGIGGLPSPAAPSLDAAGNVYFHAGVQRDLYVATRSGNSYLPPALITELATSTRDAAPFVSADGTFMMFEHDGALYDTHR